MRVADLRPRLADERGFTLPEILMATVIGLILVAGAAFLLGSAGRGQAESAETASLIRDGRAMVERVAREVRTGESVEISEENHLQLLAYDGPTLVRIDYQCAAGTCERTVTPADGGATVSSESIDGLASDSVFTYEPSAADPELVNVALDYASSTGANEVAVRDGAMLRNRVPEPAASEGCEPDSATARPTRDASTWSFQPTTNFGRPTSLIQQKPLGTTRLGSAISYRFYVIFGNLPTIPEGCELSSASLQVRVGTGWGWTRPMLISRADSSWSETSINWSNQPAPVGGSYPITEQTGENCLYTINSSAVVEELYQEGVSNFGFVLRDSEELVAPPPNLTPLVYQREIDDGTELTVAWE